MLFRLHIVLYSASSPSFLATHLFTQLKCVITQKFPTDIGYVQGMNEVLSMFLVTVENKTVAYWGYSNYTLRNKLFFNSTGLMAKLSKYVL